MVGSVNVADLAADLLGLDPGRRPVVRPTSSPAAFLVDLPDGTVVAKFPAVGRPGSALVEAWAYEEAAAHGLRVPAILAVSEDPELVLIESLDGQSLWPEGTSTRTKGSAWRRAGAELRTLHETSVSGFGPLLIDSGSVRGESDAWCPFATFTRDVGLARLVDAGYLDAKHAAQLERRYEEAAPLMAWPDGRLLHGDLEGGHVFVDAAGDYRGLIDFGQAQAGDPRWDLARVPLWDGEDALDALLDGYGRDTLGAGDRELLFPLYLLAFVVRFAVRLIDQVGQEDNIREHLAQADYRRLL